MRIVITFVMVLTLANVAHAEEQLGNVQESNVTHVTPLRRIFVETSGGRTLTGQFLSADESNVTLLVNGTPINVPFTNVHRLQADGDSVRDGARRGALVLGVWCAIVCRHSVPGIWPYAVAINTAVGAFVGAGVDSLVAGRTTVYMAPRESERIAREPHPLAQVRLRF